MPFSPIQYTHMGCLSLSVIPVHNFVCMQESHIEKLNHGWKWCACMNNIQYEAVCVCVCFLFYISLFAFHSIGIFGRIFHLSNVWNVMFVIVSMHICIECADKYKKCVSSNGHSHTGAQKEDRERAEERERKKNSAKDHWSIALTFIQFAFKESGGNYCTEAIQLA